jgi:hypothetical protein
MVSLIMMRNISIKLFKKLWPIGEVSPNDLKFVLKIFYGMLQPNKTLNYWVWSYHHELEKMLILYEYANVTIKNKSCI